MRVTMTQDEFNDKLEADTAAEIFGVPCMLIYQSGHINDIGCRLEFVRIQIEGNENLSTTGVLASGASTVTGVIRAKA